ncbi:MAG TPA: helix-turn-helix domain-containing protein [Candidatus Binataceae bacterium]|nr:helix-turn-helix domain-containing protein [Candidatus Binataceae bacterium]
MDYKLARKKRGEDAKRIARQLGVDRKTIKRWLKLWSWQLRQGRHAKRVREGERK